MTDKDPSSLLDPGVFPPNQATEIFFRAPDIWARLDALSTAPQISPQLLVVDLEPPAQALADLLVEQKQRNLRLPFPILLISSARDVQNLSESLRRGEYGREAAAAEVECLHRELSIDPVTLTLSRLQIPSLPLTSKEFQIMALIKESRALSASRGDIIKRVWQDVHVSAKTLDVHLFNLRKKIESLGLELRFRAPHFYALSATRPAKK